MNLILEASPRDMIMCFRQEAAAMGANDCEIPAIDRIVKDLDQGHCSPEDALTKVRQILSSKQDYH